MASTQALEALENMPVHETTAAMRERMEAEEKAIREKSEAKDTPEKSLETDPRTKEEWLFDFSYTDGRGKTWSGKFKNRVLTIAMNQRVGVLQSEMAMHKPVESIDSLTREINLAVAHMMVSLDPESLPLWARDLRALHSTSLLFKLYEEVASHEAIFHGLPATPARSEENGQ